MRKQLATNEGVRTVFTATFVRLGKKINIKGYSEETILLSGIKELSSNKVLADHLWFGYSKAFQSVDLRAGSVIQFDARVKQYTKGYVNKRFGIDKRQNDFKLSHPTRVKLAEKVNEPLQ